MSVGQKIRDRRKELGMTQKQLGELCGMADSAIRKYESGKITPKHNTLKKIAHALQLPAHALSGIYLEVNTDGSGAAVIDLSKFSEASMKMLTQNDDPNRRIGILFRDEGERQALEYFLEYGTTSPEWINRLVDAFNKLDFHRQQRLVSTAEYWIFERQYEGELEKISTLTAPDTAE